MKDTFWVRFRAANDGEKLICEYNGATNPHVLEEQVTVVEMENFLRVGGNGDVIFMGDNLVSIGDSITHAGIRAGLQYDYENHHLYVQATKVEVEFGVTENFLRVEGAIPGEHLYIVTGKMTKEVIG